MVLLDFVGVTGEPNENASFGKLVLDIHLGELMQQASSASTDRGADLCATYLGCDAVRLSARFANGALRSMLRYPTPQHYEALLAELLASEPLVLTALKDTCIALLEGAVAVGPGPAPGVACALAPPHASHVSPSYPLVVQHPIPGSSNRVLVPLTLHPVVLRRRRPMGHSGANGGAARPAQPGSERGVVVAAVALRYSLSSGLWVMHEQLHRCLAALSGLPSCVTLLSNDGGLVLYQNAASVAYMGLRQGCTAATAAAAAAATASGGTFGDPRGWSLSSAWADGADGRGGGSAHGLTYGADVCPRSGGGCPPSGILRQLFALSPRQWQEACRELSARRHWKGIVHVPHLLTRQHEFHELQEDQQAQRERQQQHQQEVLQEKLKRSCQDPTDATPGAAPSSMGAANGAAGGAGVYGSGVPGTGADIFSKLLADLDSAPGDNMRPCAQYGEEPLVLDCFIRTWERFSPLRPQLQQNQPPPPPPAAPDRPTNLGQPAKLPNHPVSYPYGHRVVGLADIHAADTGADAAGALSDLSVGIPSSWRNSLSSQLRSTHRRSCGSRPATARPSDDIPESSPPQSTLWAACPSTSGAAPTAGTGTGEASSLGGGRFKTGGVTAAAETSVGLFSAAIEALRDSVASAASGEHSLAPVMEGASMLLCPEDQPGGAGAEGADPGATTTAESEDRSRYGRGDTVQSSPLGGIGSSSYMPRSRHRHDSLNGFMSGAGGPASGHGNGSCGPGAASASLGHFGRGIGGGWSASFSVQLTSRAGHGAVNGASIGNSGTYAAANFFASGLRGAGGASVPGQNYSMAHGRQPDDLGAWPRPGLLSGEGAGSIGGSGLHRSIDAYTSLPDRNVRSQYKSAIFGMDEGNVSGGGLYSGGGTGRSGLSLATRQSIELRRTALGVGRSAGIVAHNPLSTSTWALVADPAGRSAGGDSIRRYTSFSAAVRRASTQYQPPSASIPANPPGTDVTGGVASAVFGDGARSGQVPQRSGTGHLSARTPPSSPAVVSSAAANASAVIRAFVCPLPSTVTAAATAAASAAPATTGASGPPAPPRVAETLAPLGREPTDLVSDAIMAAAAMTDDRPAVLQLPVSAESTGGRGRGAGAGGATDVAPAASNSGAVGSAADASLPAAEGAAAAAAQTDVPSSLSPVMVSPRDVTDADGGAALSSSPRRWAVGKSGLSKSSLGTAVTGGVSSGSGGVGGAGGAVPLDGDPACAVRTGVAMSPAAALAAAALATASGAAGNARERPCGAVQPLQLSSLPALMTDGAPDLAGAAPGDLLFPASLIVDGEPLAADVGTARGPTRGSPGAVPCQSSTATPSRTPSRTPSMAVTGQGLMRKGSSKAARQEAHGSIGSMPPGPKTSVSAAPGGGGAVSSTAAGGAGGAPYECAGHGSGDCDEGSWCWHEVTITPMESHGSQMLLVMQTDVSARVVAERQIAKVLEAEHQLLESIFPRHVLEHAADAARKGADKQGGAAQYRLTRLPLGQDSASIATYHPMVTILFADIKGFTNLCHEIPATSVMRFLNNLYSRLDTLLDVYGVYKVETIGDCYMVAGGLMTRDADGFMTVRGPGSVDDLHAAKTMAFAKAMLREAAEVQLPTTGRPVEMRIGLHSGPVMSGIVGSKMPRFCLFGDTVNTASRMESTCPPGCIHVSATTKALLQDEEWDPTGGVQVKGLGVMDTFRWHDSGNRDRRSHGVGALARCPPGSRQTGKRQPGTRTRRASTVVLLSSPAAAPPPAAAAAAAAASRLVSVSKGPGSAADGGGDERVASGTTEAVLRQGSSTGRGGAAGGAPCSSPEARPSKVLPPPPDHLSTHHHLSQPTPLVSATAVESSDAAEAGGSRVKRRTMHESFRRSSTVMAIPSVEGGGADVDVSELRRELRR